MTKDPLAMYPPCPERYTDSLRTIHIYCHILNRGEEEGKRRFCLNCFIPGWKCHVFLLDKIREAVELDPGEHSEGETYWPSGAAAELQKVLDMEAEDRKQV
jgi:hypothetical protein